MLSSSAAWCAATAALVARAHSSPHIRGARFSRGVLRLRHCKRPGFRPPRTSDVHPTSRLLAAAKRHRYDWSRPRKLRWCRPPWGNHRPAARRSVSARRWHRNGIRTRASRTRKATVRIGRAAKTHALRLAHTSRRVMSVPTIPMHTTRHPDRRAQDLPASLIFALRPVGLWGRHVGG